MTALSVALSTHSPPRFLLRLLRSSELQNHEKDAIWTILSANMSAMSELLLLLCGSQFTSVRQGLEIVNGLGSNGEMERSLPCGLSVYTCCICCRTERFVSWSGGASTRWLLDVSLRLRRRGKTPVLVGYPIPKNIGSRSHLFVHSYEVQLAEGYRGLGLGQFLVDELITIGRKWRMEKVMLTVLKGSRVFPIEVCYSQIFYS